jgi:hypothetical protein
MIGTKARTIVLAALSAIGLLIAGLTVAAPAEASVAFWSARPCLHNGAYEGDVLVGWGYVGTEWISPTQVKFINAGLRVYKMENWYYRDGHYSNGVAFPQTGQTSQTHNWGPLPAGYRRSNTYVTIRLTEVAPGSGYWCQGSPSATG